MAIVFCPTWFVLAVILQQHSSYCAFLEVLKKNKSNSFVVLKEENILTSDTCTTLFVSAETSVGHSSCLPVGPASSYRLSCTSHVYYPGVL